MPPCRSRRSLRSIMTKMPKSQTEIPVALSEIPRIRPQPVLLGHWGAVVLIFQPLSVPSARWRPGWEWPAHSTPARPPMGHADHHKELQRVQTWPPMLDDHQVHRPSELPLVLLEDRLNMKSCKTSSKVCSAHGIAVALVQLLVRARAQRQMAILVAQTIRVDCTLLVYFRLVDFVSYNFFTQRTRY